MSLLPIIIPTILTITLKLSHISLNSYCTFGRLRGDSFELWFGLSHVDSGRNAGRRLWTWIVMEITLTNISKAICMFLYICTRVLLRLVLVVVTQVLDSSQHTIKLYLVYIAFHSIVDGGRSCLRGGKKG